MQAMVASMEAAVNPKTRGDSRISRSASLVVPFVLSEAERRFLIFFHLFDDLGISHTRRG